MTIAVHRFIILHCHHRQLQSRNRPHFWRSYSVLGTHPEGTARTGLVTNSSNFKQCYLARINANDHHQVVFRTHAAAFSAKTPLDPVEVEPPIEPKQYLCLESYPIGSIDRKIGGEVVLAIKQQVATRTNEGITTAFELLDRISLEVQHVRKNKRSDDGNNDDEVRLKFSLPSSLLHDVVKVCKSQWRGSSSTDLLSPRNVFERVQNLDLTAQSCNNKMLIAYSMIIYGAAVSKDPELAEEILNHLIVESKRHVKLFPNTVTFSSVIDAWAKSGQKDAPMRAQAVLQEMIKLSDAGRPKAAPDVVSFSSVALAWANSNDENAPQRAEDVLHEMHRRGFAPNSVTYLAVLTAWARSHQEQAPDRARAILKHMIKMYEQGIDDGKPTAKCYSAVISAYANRGDAISAEEIFRELFPRFQFTGDRKFLPDRVSFDTVINAWSKSGTPESPQKAEAILQRMRDLAESTGDSSLKPDVDNYNVVLAAWAHSEDENSPDRCEEMLHKMQHHYETGDVNCQPNVRSFNTVLDCWAKSSRMEAPKRAEAILSHMVRLHESGNNKAVNPNADSYNTVINAWARSRVPNAAKRAQYVFDEMMQKHKAGSHDLKPDLRAYATVITAWSRTKRKDGAEKAQVLYDHLLQCYRSGDKTLRPNAFVNNAIIDAWAKAGEPERAESILRRMESSGEELGISAYHSVMNGWSMSDNIIAMERIQVLYYELVEKYNAGDQALQPNLRTYAILITALARGKSKDGAVKAQAIFDTVMARFLSGDKNLKPSVVIYSALIDAWAKAGEPEKAEDVFREMEALPFGPMPDTVSYNTVMNAWCHSGRPDGLERTRRLYKEMQRKYQAGDQGLKPDKATNKIASLLGNIEPA